jgi:formylglycine-generating enzyme required for sulfatase activity
MGKIVKLSAVLLVAFMFATFVFIGCSDDGNGGEDDGVRRDGDVRTISVAGIDIEVVYVSAGAFTMGNSSFSHQGWGGTERQVTLTRGFWIGKYSVTQAQYEVVTTDNPSLPYCKRPNNPVTVGYSVGLHYYIGWRDAVAFAEAVGGRLPTEAEWEFAARGGNKSQGFIYSGSNDLCEVAWLRSGCDRNLLHCEGATGGWAHPPQPVGLLQPNELGIYDMSGNVWELVSDWWEMFDGTSVTDPTGPAIGEFRVIRGSSIDFMSPVGVGYAVTERRPIDTSWGNRGSIGFRIVFDAD